MAKSSIKKVQVKLDIRPAKGTPAQLMAWHLFWEKMLAKRLRKDKGGNEANCTETKSGGSIR